MYILGVHDGHDAGAALVEEGKLISAVNEERFTKKKNDVNFPINSIKYLLTLVKNEEIDKIAIPWIGGSALFGRIYPKREQKRRQLWRREIKKPSYANMLFTNLMFKIIQDQKPTSLWHFLGTNIGGYLLRNRLKKLGLEKKLVFVEHHVAHASSAYYASGFKEALVITLDGAGDGLSGSVSIGENGNLRRINTFKASASLGILYGAATIATDMRYSEDEGKLMCLAAYSYPTKIEELKNISYYDENKKQLVSKFGRKYELYLAEYFRNTILWRYNREAFAYAIQKHVEEQVLKIIKQNIKETGITNVAVAGGLFSNIVINMLINELPEVKNFFVFPHMGDGGLAVGAAYYVDFLENGKFNDKQIDNLYLGPAYTNEEIKNELEKHKEITFEEISDPTSYGAELIGKENKILLWFQGRM